MLAFGIVILSEIIDTNVKYWDVQRLWQTYNSLSSHFWCINQNRDFFDWILSTNSRFQINLQNIFVTVMKCTINGGGGDRFLQFYSALSIVWQNSKLLSKLTQVHYHILHGKLLLRIVPFIKPRNG